MQIENFETLTEDGVLLKGILLIPEQPKAVIQFNCGTATKKEFYLPFVTYLSEHGYVCCLWGYRGSEPTDQLKGCTYTYMDYGIKDMPAIKKFLNQKFPDLPFMFVGHSAGGQHVGFMDDLSNVKGMISIASSSGYYGNMPLAYRLKAKFFFKVLAPLSVLVKGFVNAKPFGIMENLPKNVVSEWGDWVKQEDYFFDDKFYGKSVLKGHFKDFKFPIHVVYASDDSISNAKNIEVYWRHVFSEKGITFDELDPNEYAQKKIDHFGYFRKSMRDTLWPKLLNQLDAFLRNDK